MRHENVDAYLVALEIEAASTKDAIALVRRCYNQWRDLERCPYYAGTHDKQCRRVAKHKGDCDYPDD